MVKRENRQRIMVLIIVTFACFLAGNVQAETFPEINAQQLKSKMDTGGNLMLLNPLSDIEFNAKNIPGSVNIPLQNILITEKLPKAKNHLIVTYGLGIKSNIAIDAARMVAKRGYTNLMVFRDGIPGWTEAGFATASASPKGNVELHVLEPSQLNAKLDQYLIVDIRPESAYAMGYLPGSHAMPMAFLSLLSVELPKGQRIVVVDHNGKRSNKAAQWLTNNGFSDVSILKDGLTGYANAGFALDK